MIVNFYDLGGIPNKSTLSIEQYNGKLLNETLQSLEADTILYIEGVYWIMGGIRAHNLQNISIHIDGTLHFSTNVRHWPRDSSSRHYVLACIDLSYGNNVTLTSSTIGGGVLNGNGWAWWNVPGIGYLIHAEDRPRLLYMYKSSNTLLENWMLRDAPYWTTYFQYTHNLEIRYTSVLARRTGMDGHSLLDMTAFNTDGLDVSGKNIYIHHCNIWCQDDTIAIKDSTQNVLVEYVNVSGVGITIGSIGNSLVRNITFRHCIVYKGWKGIYLKFRESESKNGRIGRIYNVTYQDIIIYQPQIWAIWIGPAQQSDTRNICYANPCSICWPLISECSGVKLGRYRNILFQDISIISPKSGTGVIMSHEYLPMQNITFHNVHTTFCSPSTGSNSQPDMNFKDVFPYLSSIDQDDYFISDSYIAKSFVLTSVMTILCLSYNSTVKTTVKSIIQSVRQNKPIILLLLSNVVGSTSYMIYTWYHYYNIDRLQTYYSCENVDYGIATGNTFPVPHCFEDYTTTAMSSSNSKNTNGFKECSWLEQPIMLKGISTSLCFFSFVLFGYIYNRNYRNSRRFHDNNIEMTNFSLNYDNHPFI